MLSPPVLPGPIQADICSPRWPARRAILAVLPAKKGGRQ